MSSLFEGILLGLTLSLVFGFGPALFALVQTSIHRGFWSGVLLAIGIFLSDLALVALGFLGAVQIFYKPNNQFIFGIIGGILLIVFGIVTFTRKLHLPDPNNKNLKIDTPGAITYVLKGFFLNITNPFVWIFWMGVVVGFTANYQKNELLGLIVFFAATLGTVLFFDILKCFSAYKIKKYLQPRIITGINKVAGVGIVGFGIFLLIRTFLELG